MAESNTNVIEGFNIEILDWNGYQFNDSYRFSFCNENVAYVPQVQINGRNQLQRNDLWLRYYLFDHFKTHIIAVVTVGPNIESTPVNQRVGEYGLTRDVRDILGLTNVYDSEDGEKYIGYEIFMKNPNEIDPDTQDYPTGLYRNFPNPVTPGHYDNGWLDTPISNIAGDNNLYTVAVNPAHPTVSFIGNVEEAEYDPENPDTVYYASGYELQYANDYMDAFKTAIENRAISLVIRDGGGNPYLPTVQGSAPGEYVTNIKPTDLGVGQGENPREDQNLWMNFDPMFKVIRQIKLVIKTGEVDQTGISIPISASKYYDGEVWAPEVRVPEGTVVRYSTDDGGHWSTSPASIENVGTIYVTVEITGLPGQTEALYYYYYLQVLPRPIYISSDSRSWNYNGSLNTCDWVTVQGHYDESSGSSSKIQTRFTPPDSDQPNYPNGYSRIVENIPLIKLGDTMEIEFKGGQTEIGSSNNAFDFEIKSDKPNNYDVRVEFGLLKVSLNSEDIYVFIRGNTKGTWKESSDLNKLWDNDLEPEKDRSCIYNGGIWTVSGWQVVAITDAVAGIIPDPYDPHHNITIPDLSNEHDMSDVYGAKNVEFIGKETTAEVSGVYINNIIDPEDTDNFWHPIEYRSTLSELNFRNINPNFSDNHIHFIVTPNRLLISKCVTNINIAGHSQDFDFNMVKDGDKYIPEERTISGYDAISDVEIYDLADTTYLESEPAPGLKPKSTPTITACCWNETLGTNGRYYMELGNDIHGEESDKLNQFTNGFINHNKNFEVSYHLLLDDDDNPLDGYICIHPLRVNVSILGTKDSKVYSGEEQSIVGTYDHPEIWWKSDCEFFNYPAILGAIELDDPDDRWIMEIEEEVEIDPYRRSSEDPLQESSANSNTKSSIPDKPAEDPNRIMARSNYYRALHDMGYFEWTDDGSASGTEINDINDPEDPDYKNSIPYPFHLTETDFHEDKNSVFEDTEFHIYKNFDVTFEEITEDKDGSLTILPYSEEVKVYIVGESATQDYTGSPISVSGYESTADTGIYDPNISIEGPENPIVSGTEPGSYLMGLSAKDFENINKNFTNVTFLVTDGWLLIVGQGTEQDPTGDTNIHKVFDNVGVDINSIPIEGGGTLRRTMVTPGYTPAEIGNKIDSEHDVEWITPEGIYDTGTIYFKIESSDEESDIDIPGMVIIEPLRIEITSRSGAWIYDGESHLLDEVDIRVLNNNPSNISSILSFVEGITYKEWKEITSIGTISNSFIIESIPFSEHVSNKTYAVNNKLYDENGEVIGDWIETDKHDITPNVIITTQFGTLTISDSLEVKIKGLQKTITYDGRLHTLTGYEVYYNDALMKDMHISLKPTFQYEETIDQRDARETPYVMGLDVDSFDWPIGITGEVEDGWLEIRKRGLILKTGSDTGHWSDEEPEYIAKNESYTVIGLADTDHIELTGDWKSQSGPGSTDNDIEYKVTHISKDNVTDNYDCEEVWGLLKINEASDSPMYYRIMGIRKEPTTPDTNKVHIEGLKGIDYLTKVSGEPTPVFGPGNRMVDEDRFYPILHKLVPIPEDGVVDFDDIICIVPLFKHSKKMENVTWLFENKSTGEKIFSKVHDRPIFPDGIYGGALPEYKNHGGLADTPILNIVPKELKPGYYDVTVNYRMDHKDYSQKFSSVFMIRKKA